MRCVRRPFQAQAAGAAAAAAAAGCCHRRLPVASARIICLPLAPLPWHLLRLRFSIKTAPLCSALLHRAMDSASRRSRAAPAQAAGTAAVDGLLILGVFMHKGGEWKVSG